MQTLGGQTRCVKGDVQMENGSSSRRSYITYIIHFLGALTYHEKVA